jgi:hypothetical protein
MQSCLQLFLKSVSLYKSKRLEYKTAPDEGEEKTLRADKLCGKCKSYFTSPTIIRATLDAAGVIRSFEEEKVGRNNGEGKSNEVHNATARVQRVPVLALSNLN